MTELIGTHEKDIGQPNKLSGHSRHGPHERNEDSPVTPGCRERIRPGYACDHKAQLPGDVHAADISRRRDLRNRGTDATTARALGSMVSQPISDLRLRLLRRRDRRARGHLSPARTRTPSKAAPCACHPMTLHADRDADGKAHVEVENE